MANNTYILNTPILAGDPFFLHEALKKGPEFDFAEIAVVSYRVSLPWLCCFRGAQLTEVRVPLEYSGERTGPDEMVVWLPCMDVATARTNLNNSLEIFQEMAGDADVGKGYWQHACAGLAELPLPYLAMDPIEVILGGEHNEEATKLALCFKSDSPPLELLKHCSGYNDGFPPFSAEDFYGTSGAKLDHVARAHSSRALDAGLMAGHFYWHRFKPDDKGASPVDVGISEAAKTDDPSLKKGPWRRPWWRTWWRLW